MQERQKKIMNFLLNREKHITSNQLAKRFQVSARTIRNDIAALNNEIKESHAYIESNVREGYRISPENKLIILNELKAHLYDVENLFPTQPVHRQASMAIFYLFSEEAISLQKLSETFYISKSTAKADMNQVLYMLKDLQVEVKLTKKGNQIFCKEERRRKLITYIALTYLEEPRRIHLVFKLITEVNFADTYDNVLYNFIKVLNRHSIRVKDTSILSFTISCQVAFIRFHKGYTIDLQENKILSEIIFDLKDELNSFYQLSDREWMALEIEFFNRVLQKVDARDEEESKRIVSDFREILNNEYSIQFLKKDLDFFEKQVSKIIMKSRRKVIETHRFTSQIMKKYPFAYEIALNLRFLIQSDNKLVPDDDITLIAIYINSILQRNRDCVSVAIVSEFGDTILEYIKNGIENTTNNQLLNISLFYLYEMQSMLQEGKVDFDLIVETNDDLRFLAENAGIYFARISLMYEGSDVENVNALLLKSTKMRRKKEKLLALKYFAKEIEFQIIDTIDVYSMGTKYGIRHVFPVSEHLLVVRSNRRQNYICCTKLNNTFLYHGGQIKIILEYSCNSDDVVKSKQLYLIEEQIVKHVPLDKMLQCKNTEDLINLLTYTIKDEE